MTNHFQNTQELGTPVGSFSVFCGEKRMPFSVTMSKSSIPVEVIDSDGVFVGLISPDSICEVLIDAQDLEGGKEYVIMFSSGKWDYCDSDEHTTCYCTHIGDWIVGIGAYDPNDEEKEDQARRYSGEQGYLQRGALQDPPFFDEKSFKKYTVEALSDLQGYKFKVYDKDFDYVRFDVAWVRVKDFPVDAYTEALGIWLC